MKKTLPALIVLVLAAAAAGYYYWLQGRTAPAAPTAPVAAAPSPSLPAPAAPAANAQIRHPIENLPPDATPLPSLEQSDDAVMAALRDLLGSNGLQLLFTDRIVHRIVATVDALPRKQVPAAARPVKPLQTPFLVQGKDGDLAMAPENAARYLPYVALARSVDAGRLLYLYRRFYPLFQQEYRELGYPQGYFNDRLIEAIDDLLAAPEPSPPLRLVQPKVLYLYADPELEALSAGQKIMMRMGAENEQAVKAKLWTMRRILTAGDAGKRKQP
ncbi:MAG TPA: DUF3014 domain-containing protein [Rhodocyclaceae bacterium]